MSKGHYLLCKTGYHIRMSNLEFIQLLFLIYDVLIYNIRWIWFKSDYPRRKFQITQDVSLIYNVHINISNKCRSSLPKVRLENKICFESICAVLNKNLDS